MSLKNINSNKKSKLLVSEEQVKPAFYSFQQACIRLGMATQSGRNLLRKNEFPVPTLKNKGKRQVSIILLENHINSLISAVSNLQK